MSGKNSPKVAYVYDEQMTEHAPPSSIHPEKPERIIEAMKGLNEAGLAEQMVPLKPREASVEEMELGHTSEYITKLQNSDSLGQPSRDLLLSNGSFCQGSVYANDRSVFCARLAAGCSIQAALAVARGDFESSFAVVRPPGHHAEAHCCMGFCFLNNVVLAALAALEAKAAERVLIVDWDVHHGNGVQNMLYGDKRVLYTSIHRYNHGKFYPGTKEAGPDFTGGKGAQGFNVNIGWNSKMMGDKEYMEALNQVILPVAQQFKPNLILVSAGFDAARHDRMGGMDVTSRGYHSMTRALLRLAREVGGCGLCLLLEGGYLLPALREGVAACCSALLGLPPPEAEQEELLSLMQPQAAAKVPKKGGRLAKFFNHKVNQKRIPKSEVEEEHKEERKEGPRKVYACKREALVDIQLTIAAHKPFWCQLKDTVLVDEQEASQESSEKAVKDED